MRMPLRLTGFEMLDDMRAAAPRLRDALAPWLARARTTVAPWLAQAGERLAPARARLAAEIARSTTLTAAVAAVARVWGTLVEAFCATIDPYLSRWFPDLRLVAVLSPSGAIEMTRTSKSEMVSLGTIESFDPAAVAALSATRWTAVELRLRPDQVLQKTISLPAASRDFLGSIIEHKLERLTPWRPDRVLYGYRVADTGETGAALAVELVATSKDIVAAPLQALGALGLSPTAIGLAGDAATTPLAVNLLLDPPKGARVGSRRMVSRVALATFAAIGGVWLSSAMWASSADDAAQVAGARLVKARRLLKIATMGEVGERERTLLEAKAPDRAIVVLVDKLAQAIPADTWLKELAIAPDKVRLVGVTTNAPALVGEVEKTGLANVRFTSAVTREKDGTDSFEISADRPAASREEAP